MRTALVTGGTRGLGHAIVRGLLAAGWEVTTTARSGADLARMDRHLGRRLRTLVGDVTDPVHRACVAEAVGDRLDLLVNNASTLGPTPRPRLHEVDIEELRATIEVNVLAPLALVRALRPALLVTAGTIVNVTSDAAVEHWDGWGTYGLSKAALDHASGVLAVESGLRVLAVDPGDLQTDMHQAAFPGEDISDRPSPDTVVPALLHLLDDASSGRYRLPDLLARAEVGA